MSGRERNAFNVPTGFSSFADSSPVCPDCGQRHPGDRTCTEHRGYQALNSAREHRIRRRAELAGRLSAQVSDAELYPLLPLYEFADGARELAKTVRDQLLILGRAGRVKSRPEVDPRGIDVIHHRLLSLHGLLTRHVTGVDSRRWLQSRQWVRRAAHLLARPSDTTHTASPPAGMVTPAVAGEGAPGPVSPIRRPGASTHGGAA